MQILRSLRKQHNISQKELADALGVSRSAVAMWETGKSQPDNEALIAIARLFCVTTDYLLCNSSPAQGNVRIPVLGRVAAGIPIEAVQDVMDYEEIDSMTAERGEYFALKIRGDSMEPKISNGDVVIVRKQTDIESGEIAVVLVNGNEATCKRVIRHKDGILLVANNPAYSPVFYTLIEVEQLPVKIIGKVVELRAKF